MSYIERLYTHCSTVNNREMEEETTFQADTSIIPVPHGPTNYHTPDQQLGVGDVFGNGPDIVATEIRRRTHSAHFDVSGDHSQYKRSVSGDHSHYGGSQEQRMEDNYVIITPENAIEAQRMINNHKFGFKKWKSHVTFRPLSQRSDVVKDLYADIASTKPVRVSTCGPSNCLYVLLVGWWLSLLYLLMAAIMTATVIGLPYASYCLKMSKYFLWPFGKFVYLSHSCTLAKLQESPLQEHTRSTAESTETSSLLGSPTIQKKYKVCSKTFWGRLCSYPWLLFGGPVLLIAHIAVAAVSWFFVVTIPISKVNQRMITHVLWLPPEEVSIGDSGSSYMEPERIHSEIIMFTHQSVNVYYFKYTVDGMNIILVNLLVFVILALVIGYTKPPNVSGVVICILAVLAVIPLTYYIGMAIISISAQSSFAIGVVLNATFGSVVEIILYVISMRQAQLPNGSFQPCYAELVKSALAGTLIGSILFIPGLCMVVGGIKYTSQRFNPKAASVTALLLFVAILGVFSPSFFSKIFGDLQCDRCEMNTTRDTNTTYGLQCSGCKQSLEGLDGDNSLYDKHIEPLVYAIAIVLPIAYITGVLFTLKTHTSYVYDEFYQQVSFDESSGPGAPQWSRLKGVVILIGSAVLIALCGDLIADNIQTFLRSSGISEYFIGVTMIGMVPELPEIVNGVQFALQNNVNLGIEIGTSTAIQVCLIQVPILVLINLIFPMNFLLTFNDVHVWAVVFAVIVINYIFQDGKSDYFQGAALVSIYIILLCVYFFMPVPTTAVC
ncbi:uncharacterized protein LOC127842626 isoform X9 [Dreissena polymorpha]|nr:uncharacterized protein LOC127842626 isoform X1 [Dreissena polymorpha]XP_052228180.1 uncharacterized protein LOC127842626 isoform X3 [Dreissena polymorpha]XP_052228181.1 uncharacterized protein LOC127842626 isoform X4 [Dreissena polymorpha]XP_052228182.1 uncharacterized protein LOC127842626 isoform X5 [Dreissena polymorpha]XP_052228183.1 uncharacterized protein LOC127842626 isoform X6 [Dreissena polymorpha]XP_052228184.1 uncharacterized protein LOC127842626 isoform X7 [Dreissena polymorpha]